MLLQTINKDNEKVVWFDSSHPRYYKKFNNALYYSDDLQHWRRSRGQDTIAIHLIKDELGVDQ